MKMANAIAYRGLDPDLPSIAALAAAEVDELINQRHSEIENLKRLADVLQTSFDSSNMQAGAKRFLDPISTNVFVNSLRDARQAKLSSYDELAQASLELASQMEKAAGEAGN